jgi:outer membrane protein OmpA-like peptidoglycan-associated protein
MTSRSTLLFSTLLLALLIPAPALAQENFALDRYEPSERGSDWFANESLDLRGHVRPALGVVGDWAYRPLVFYDQNGDEAAAVVEHQVFAHVGGGLILWERLRLGVSVPLLVFTRGDSLEVANNSFSTDEGTTIGDPRFALDLRLFGEYRSAASLAIGAQVFAPVGNQDAFASDGKIRVRPRLMLAGDLGPLAYAAQVGFNFRARDENLGDEEFGNEAVFSAGLGLRTPDGKLLVGPEVFGSTVVSDSGDGAFKRRTTPLEVIFGAKYRVSSDWRIGAGVGPGLTRGVGAPQLRGLLSIEWMPDIEKEKEPSDRDKDGILDDDDACPDTYGAASEDPKKHGCPEEAPPAGPGDKDGDGILDDKDACPDEKGVPSDDPKKHGCPLPPDRDGDTIIDDQDACPDEKGEPSDDPKKHGCPPPKDTDGDGIFDPEDACPDKPGEKDPDPKKHGCPKAFVEKGEIKILEQVQFATASDRILPASDTILEAVFKILSDHPEITKVSVEGHTDSRGGAAYNRGLSKRRAASVVKWLVKRGVDKGRLTSQGFGPDKPIDSNETEDGRQRNRRVEFLITEKKEGGP